jgi:signal transduction histidine kinase
MGRDLPREPQSFRKTPTIRRLARTNGDRGATVGRRAPSRRPRKGYSSTMSLQQRFARDGRWRVLALLAASGFPAAMDLGHRMGQGVRVDVPSLVATTASAFVLLALLTRVFDAAVARRLSGARCFALVGGTAVVAGVAESFAGWALAGHLCLPAQPPGHDDAVVVARMGAVNGVLVLGLFAMAIALPFAASGARETERLRATAELVRLRANLQPHFLFNTLSTISGLIAEDPREARRLVARLGDLLRDSLVEADDMRTIDEEIRWLEHYASILETRHRGALSFAWKIDEEARQLQIPRLLLQPLVENAVKHGALRRPEGGAVAVRAKREAGGVTFVIEDNGPGPSSAGTTRPGAMGLDLVKRRLSLRYGTAAQFRLESGGGCTRSIVSLPAERTP